MEHHICLVDGGPHLVRQRACALGNMGVGNKKQPQAHQSIFAWGRLGRWKTSCLPSPEIPVVHSARETRATPGWRGSAGGSGAASAPRASLPMTGRRGSCCSTAPYGAITEERGDCRGERFTRGRTL